MAYTTVDTEGKVCSDPVVRTTTTGKQVGNFNLSVWGGKDKPYMFFKVAAWGALAPAAENLKKGDYVHVEGTLYSDNYGDKERFGISASSIQKATPPWAKTAKDEEPF